MKSQEYSSLTSRFTYHVFLSFGGEDTRKTFTDHLYTVLVHSGFRTFRDDDGLERGEDIKFELEKAIRESRMSIIVFSKGYASSTWCLEELVMILKNRTSGHAVLPVFYDVDPSEVRKQNGTFEEVFARHEEKLKSETGELREKLKDKIRTWRVALREVVDVAGMILKNQADGHEARFIQKIIKVVGDKVSRTTLDIAPHLVGIHSQVKNIQLWVEDELTNVGMVAICGMGGIGKTTIAKLLYNLNFSRFEASSFLENVRESSQQQDGLLRLQRRLLSDILKTREVQPNSIAEGASMIKGAIHCKRVFLVLDDVDKLDQLDAILGMQDWFFSGSKIIITTRRERLLRANEFSKVHRVENLVNKESLELFSWHAFGKCCPNNGYEEVSKRVVGYCGGLPLALKVLGSSLSGQCLNVWKSQLDKLKMFPEGEILEKLRISYDSLQDDHDKYLFITLACFFVGSDKDSTITILDGCDFYTVVGIQNLIDRCLISVDEHNKLVMHHLLQDMGRKIDRKESSQEPGERRILWNHKDAFNVLTEFSGTSKIEGFKLDMSLLEEYKNFISALCDNRKRRLEEILEKPICYKLKQYGLNIFSSNHEAVENSKPVLLEAEAFGRLRKLKLLHLNQVHISGPYKKLPKGLKWLCWRGFPLKSIPSDFPLESLVALDMHYSSLKNVWDGTKFLVLLKILNLSYSHDLTKTPDFSKIPNLERLVLKNCANLVEVHESIGYLKRLVLLNLRDCKNLRKLPNNIGMLKLLERLVISGCSKLEELPPNMGKLASLTVLKVDGIALNESLCTNEKVNAMQAFIQPWLLKTRRNPEISWASLPRSLVKLSLAGCNLSDNAFPRDLSKLCSLKTLDVCRNPISSLPDFIRGLTSLERLHIKRCPRLRKIIGLPQVRLFFDHNKMLEEVTELVFHGPKVYCLDACDHEGKTVGIFKLEPIENVAIEITKNLGLSNLQSMGNRIVKLSSICGKDQHALPIQGCHGRHIFNTYVLGCKVPLWFRFNNLGSSVYFTVPSNLNSRVRGLSICSVYEQSSAPPDYYHWRKVPHIVVSNRTKGLIWSYIPEAFGVGEGGNHVMWLSYWKFEEHLLEAGDELNVLVLGGEFVQFKELGVHLLYNEEQQENVSHQIHPFGNIIRGNVFARPSSRKLYLLGGWVYGCDDCRHPALTSNEHDKFRCIASDLLRPQSYDISDSGLGEDLVC